MPLHGKLFGKIAVGSGLGAGGNSAPAPLNPPTILSFTLDDMSLDTGVEGTFSWTKSGTQTGAVLDPGDGSGNYTLTTESSQPHTYDAEGVYDATLTLSGPGGSSTPATINDIVVSVAGGVAYQQVTTLKSDTSGEQWAFFGLPGGTPGTISSARKSKIVAEYPIGSGTFYPCQVDNHLSKEADGSLIHAACSVKLPSGYVAEEKVGIGYSDTYSFPSAPNWSTVKAANPASFDAKFSIYRPKICLFYIKDTPHVGDVIEITLGGTTFTQEINSFDLLAMNNYFTELCHAISRRITQTAGSAFKAYENTSAYVLPFDMDHNDARNPFADFAQFGKASWQAKVTQNAPVDRGMQLTTGQGFQASFTPISWVNGSGTAAAAPASGYYANAFPIWSTWEAGNPTDYTATFSITKQGRFVNLSSGASSFGRGNRILNYDGGTQAFTVGQRVKGATSGAEGEIVAISGNTTAGKLLLKYVRGTFIDNESLSGRVFQYGRPDLADSAGSGAALANGADTNNVLTGGTSGATARIVDADPYGRAAYALAVVMISGTFTNGETVTDGMTGSGTLSSIGSVSNAQLQTGATTAAASGSLPVIQAAENRVEWTVDYSDGTLQPFGAWLDGHQVREETVIAPLMNGATPHDHLVARMTVRWDRDGNRIDHQLRVENPKMFAWARDYWYDVQEINVGGVNQIPSDHATLADLDDYKQLMHTPWAKWEWHQQQPFQMCDPLHFFDAWLMPRYRQFTRDMTHGFDCVLKGNDALGDRIFNKSTTFLGPRLDKWAKDKIGMPLYACNIKMDAGGGASPSIGVHNGWEWAFWSNDDKATLWPMLEAFAGNAFGAFPFYPRDEAGPDADWQDSTPHPYLRWQYNLTHSRGQTADGRGTANADRYKLAVRSEDQLHRDTAAVTGAGGSDSMPAEISMWKGSVWGGYGSGRNMAYSHAPPHPGRSAYLVRPEQRFHDDFTQYSWAMGTCLPGPNVSNRTLSPPKTGGVAGDPDHVLGTDPSNGPRYFAWNARSWMMAASISFDRHFMRDTLRRASNDLKNHAVEMASNTWNGLATVAGSRHSDNWQSFPNMGPGQPNRDLSGVLVASGGLAPQVDLFKGGYLYAVLMNAHLLDVIDGSALADLVGPVYARMVTDLPSDKWFFFMGMSGLYTGETDGNSGNSTPQTFYASTNFNDVRHDQEGKSNAWKAQLNGCATAPYSATPQPDFYPAGFGASSLSVPNYSIYAFRRDLMLLFRECVTSPSDKTALDGVIDLLDGYLPPDEVDVGGRGSPEMDRYDYNWGVMARVRPAEMTTPW